MEDVQSGPPGELFTEAAPWAVKKQLWEVGQGREEKGRWENNRVRDTRVLMALGAVKQGMSAQLREYSGF